MRSLTFALLTLTLTLALVTPSTPPSMPQPRPPSTPPAIQKPAPDPVPIDGPAHPFQDSLIADLAGHWTMTGRLLGKPATYDLHADWTLGHQFLKLEMRDVNSPPAYEAHVYLGRDNASERYVAHWIDAFGGRWSETLGYGHRDGAAVRFVFEYPDGPFTTTFTRDDGTKGWTVQMRQKSKAGVWEDFARYDLRRLPAR